jgi:hypothetical protein
MRAFLAFSFAAAIVMMPARASAQLTREACLDYCEGEKSKDDGVLQFELRRQIFRQEIREKLHED